MQSGFLEAAREEVDAQIAEVAELQKQIATKSAGLSQLSAKRGEPNDDLRRVKSQHAADATVSDDLNLSAGACERPPKRAKMTGSFKVFRTTF